MTLRSSAFGGEEHNHKDGNAGVEQGAGAVEHVEAPKVRSISAPVRRPSQAGLAGAVPESTGQSGSERSGAFENSRDAEDDVFVGGSDFAHRDVEAGPAGGDDALHEGLRGGGAGGEAEGGYALEPGPVDIVGGGDEVGGLRA